MSFNVNTGLTEEDKQKVVITGIGVVSPIGIGKDAFWQGLKEGRSGIKPVTLFDTSTTRSKLAGEITDFKPEEILGPKGLRNLDRTTKLALCAAKLALDDANFQITEENTHDVGVVLGSTMGSVWSISEFDKQALKEGPRSVNPALFANTVINSPASQISIRFNIRGFNTTIATGFSSSFDAIRYGIDFLRLGRAKAVLVGGVEELCEHVFKGFSRLNFLSPSGRSQKELMCPFDRRRNGAILGEGSCIFIIENLNNAVSRNSPIYGEILSEQSTYDERFTNRYDVRTTESAEVAVVREALHEAMIGPSQVDCIIASANSSLKGDYSEAKSLRRVFGNDINHIPVTAPKSTIGETFSAAGLFLLASSTFILGKKIIPSVSNYVEEDTRIGISTICREPIEIKARRVLANSFGPSGQNASVVLGAWN